MNSYHPIASIIPQDFTTNVAGAGKAIGIVAVNIDTANIITKSGILGKSIYESTLRDVYCIGRNCPRVCDWLLFIPNAPALWSLGAMALLFGIIAAVKFHSRKHWHIEVMHSESLIILLGLSMMLRAALTLPGGSRVGLYSASLFFNYYSGMCAYSGLVFGALSITKRRDPLSKRKTRMLFTSRILLSFVPSILLIIGVAFMFHPPAHNYVAGTRCIQTVLAIVIFVTLASAAVFIKRFSRIRLAVDKHNITSTIVYFVLLELWAVFMFSRTLVSLHSPARTSQVMFFLLNYLPLMIICLVSFTLDKPLALKYVRQNDNLEELVKATNDANHPADVGKKEPVSGDNNA